MATLLQQASDVAAMRNARMVGIEDLLFLMRKDKIKLRRLIKYMELRDVKCATMKAFDDDESAEQGDKPVPMKKRRKICYDFVSSIDQTGELISLFDNESLDEVKHERCMRAELQSRGMDAQQYMDFTEARQTSFSRKYKSQKFKDWLLLGLHVDIKPSPLSLEVVSYLAYETVAQIVDLSLLVKRDKLHNPLDRNLPGICINYHNAMPVAPPDITSPSGSPPSTPTTPGTQMPGLQLATPLGSGLSSSQSSLNASHGSTASKAKSKKRKKSGTSTSVDLGSTGAIHPEDIREAIRRYHENSGPFSSNLKINCLLPSKLHLFAC